jgi:hypothetical protein
MNLHSLGVNRNTAATMLNLRQTGTELLGKASATSRQWQTRRVVPEDETWPVHFE